MSNIVSTHTPPTDADMGNPPLLGASNRPMEFSSFLCTQTEPLVVLRPPLPSVILGALIVSPVAYLSSSWLTTPAQVMCPHAFPSSNMSLSQPLCHLLPASHLIMPQGKHHAHSNRVESLLPLPRSLHISFIIIVDGVLF